MADGTISYQIKVDNTGAITSLKQVQTTAEGVSAATGEASSNVGKMGIAAGIAAAVTQKGLSMISSSLGQAVSRADTLRNFPRVMESLGVSSKKSSKALQRLSDGIEGLPTTLDSAASGVQRLVSVNGDIDKSTEYFLALNNAIAAGGANMQTQQSAVEQLMQSYSKGKMDMMEWRSIQTAMPAQLKQVAAAFGLTTNELGEGLRSGEIAMEDFMQTLVALNKDGSGELGSLEEQARAATGGIGTSFANFKTSITKSLADVLLKLNESGAITNFFDTMKAAVKGVGKAFTLLAGIIAPLIPYLTQLVPVVIGMAVAWKLYELWTMRSVIATKVLSAALLTNPFGIILAAIGAVVGAIVLLWKNSEEFREAVTRIWAAIKEQVAPIIEGIKNALIKTGEAIKIFWEALKSAASAVWEFISGVFGETKEAFSRIAEAIRDDWQKVKDFFTSVVQALNTVAEWFVNMWQSAKEKLDAVITGIYNAVTTGFGAFGTFFNYLKEKVVAFINWFKELPARIRETLDNVVSKVNTWINNMGAKAREAASTFISNLWNNLQSLPSRMLEFGLNIVQGIAQGIRNAAGAVWDALKSCVTGAWDKVKEWLHINSPSKRFRDTVGVPISEGVAVGIEQGASTYVTSAMDSLIAALNPRNIQGGTATGASIVNNYFGNIGNPSERLNSAAGNFVSAVQLELRMG